MRFATEHANALEPRVPHLRLALPRCAQGVTILLDGVVLEEASLGVALPIDPGAHAIEAKTATGTTVRSVTVAEGETAEATIELPPTSPASEGSPGHAPPAQMRAHSSAQRTVGWTLAATGAVGLAASLVLGGLVLKEKSAVADDCKAKKCTPAGLAAGHDDGSIFAFATTMRLAVGVGALRGGTYLVLSAANPAAPHSTGLSSVLLQGNF